MTQKNFELLRENELKKRCDWYCRKESDWACSEPENPVFIYFSALNHAGHRPKRRNHWVNHCVYCVFSPNINDGIGLGGPIYGLFDSTCFLPLEKMAIERCFLLSQHTKVTEFHQILLWIFFHSANCLLSKGEKKWICTVYYWQMWLF